MKKITKFLLLSSMLLTSISAFDDIKIEDKTAGFLESATDYVENNSLIKKSALIGEDSQIETSKIYAQTGETAEGKKCLRFAIAIKGNVETISFQRGHVEGKEDVNSYQVNTLYKGILAEDKVLYYNPEAVDSNDGLTSSPDFAGEYYWACYTIRFLDENFLVSNIPLSVTINGKQIQDRKASFAEMIYGTHTHKYDLFASDETQHYKTCSLCGTIDDTSYQVHSYNHYNPVFKKVYENGEEYHGGDLTLYKSCECHKNSEEINYSYLQLPEKATFGEKVLLKTDSENLDISLPVNYSKKMSKLDSELKYGGGNAGIVGQETNFRFKQAYEIVDGQFKLVGTENDYSYGNCFVNIDMNINNKPYIQFPVKVNSDTKVNLIMSSSNNYVSQNGEFGSYAQDLNKNMDILIDNQVVEYNDITLEAIPQSALDGVGLNQSSSGDEKKKYMYFTFKEYNLMTLSLSKGEHIIRFNFKNGYEGTGAASVDTDNICAGYINYFRLESIAEASNHTHNYTKHNYDENYHWNECLCGLIDETSKEKHHVDIEYLNGDYRVGSTFDINDISVKYNCECGYVNDNLQYTVKNMPSTSLNIGDSITLGINGVNYDFVLPVYELNIKQVPVKTDYTEGELFDPKGLILNKKYLDRFEDYTEFNLDEVTFVEKVLTTQDNFVEVTYDNLSIKIPVNVRHSSIKVELEDNLSVTYTEGTNVAGNKKIMPGSKLKITRNAEGKYIVDNKSYDTYEEAYEVAYQKGSSATKTQVAQASAGDFLAFLDGTGATFTVNLKDIASEQMELYIRGASNYVEIMKNWTPYKIGDMVLNEFMTVRVNGEELALADNLVLPGCGDGTKGDHAYWTNWTTLDLGTITLDPSLEINTIEFSVDFEKGLNENGKYKYLYNDNTQYAFGQYDYILLEEKF